MLAYKAFETGELQSKVDKPFLVLHNQIGKMMSREIYLVSCFILPLHIIY
jgi:hypothetical protein